MPLLPVTITQDGLFAAFQMGIITLDETRAALGLDPYVAPVQADVPPSKDEPQAPAQTGLSLV